jgi:hypothetical protein
MYDMIIFVPLVLIISFLGLRELFVAPFFYLMLYTPRFGFPRALEIKYLAASIP